MSRPMRAAFKEDIDRGMYQPEGLIRLDDKVKHPTLILTEDQVYGYARQGFSIRHTAVVCLGLPQSTFYDLLKNTGRLDRYKELMGNAGKE